MTQPYGTNWIPGIQGKGIYRDIHASVKTIIKMFLNVQLYLKNGTLLISRKIVPTETYNIDDIFHKKSKAVF